MISARGCQVAVAIVFSLCPTTRPLKASSGYVEVERESHYGCPSVRFPCIVQLLQMFDMSLGHFAKLYRLLPYCKLPLHIIGKVAKNTWITIELQLSDAFPDVHYDRHYSPHQPADRHDGKHIRVPSSLIETTHSKHFKTDEKYHVSMTSAERNLFGFQRNCRNQKWVDEAVGSNCSGGFLLWSCFFFY